MLAVFREWRRNENIQKENLCNEMKNNLKRNLPEINCTKLM